MISKYRIRLKQPVVLISNGGSVMKNRWIGWMLVLGMLLCALVPVIALADADEVTLTLERVSPSSMSGAGNVTVALTIKLNINASDSMENVSVSKGGTTLTGLSNVKPGYSPTFSVIVPLSEEELGTPVTLTVSWTQGGTSYSKNLKSFTVSKAEAKTSVVFTRSADPTSLKSGEKTTLKYRVVNTGNVPVSDLKITDGSLGTVGTKDSLNAGSTWEFNVEKAVTESFTSTPTLSYTAAGETKSETLSALSINLASANLKAALSSTALEVEAGTTVTLTCSVKNTGSLDFQSLTVKDDTLGQVFSGPRLQVGASTSFTKKVTIEKESTYTFAITAKDENGENHTYKSNTVKIAIKGVEPVQTVPGTEPVRFDARIDNSRMDTDQEVDLHFTIENRTQEALTSVTIEDDLGETLVTIPSLPSGTTEQDIPYPVSRERNVTFHLYGTDAAGKVQQYSVGPLEIRFPVVETPAPTSQPTPESVPTVTPAVTLSPTPTPVPQATLPAKRGGIDSKWVLYGAMGLLGLAFLIILISLIVVAVRAARENRARRDRLNRDASRRVDRHADPGKPMHRNRRR